MKSPRYVLAMLTAAALIAGAATTAAANTAFYRITYPGGPEPNAGGRTTLGPGGAKRVIVNFTSATPNRAAPGGEINSLTTVLIRWSEPRTCGFPVATVNSATQFTLEWPGACVNPGQLVFVQVISSGTQAGWTGSWKDAGGSEVSPATITQESAAPLPGVSPASAGALVALLLACGGFAVRRRLRPSPV